jgi:DinB superfamily
MAKKKTSKKRVHSGAKGTRKAARKSLPNKSRKGAKGSTGKVSRAGKAGLTESHGQRGLDTLKWCHGTFELLLKDIPHEHYCTQFPGADNHVLWTIGHLATMYTWVLGGLDERGFKLPEGYGKLFGDGSRPVADFAAYPPVNEVKAWHDKAFTAFAAAIAAQSDSQLALPPAVDTGGMAKDRLHLVYVAAWHEGWHQGQISALRRALGLKPVL